MLIQADPDPYPGQTFQLQKVEFLHEKYGMHRVGNKSENIHMKVQQPICKEDQVWF